MCLLVEVVASNFNPCNTIELLGSYGFGCCIERGVGFGRSAGVYVGVSIGASAVVGVISDAGLGVNSNAIGGTKS